jgi:Tol biopolymer transport system component
MWAVDLETQETRKLHDGDAVGPRFSPDGTRIAFWGAPGGRRDIWTMPADGGEAVRVTDDRATDWSPFWSPDGRHLYFVSDRGGSPDLWRVRIDERTGETLGPMHPVTTGIARVWEGAMAAAAERITVGINGDAGELSVLTLDPDRGRVVGEPRVIHTAAEPFTQIHVSADGEWIAYRTSGAREHIMIVRADGSDRRQLTDDDYRNRGPVWSPDGRWIVIYSNRGGDYDLWALRPDGTGLRQLTDSGGESVNDPVWSPDGKRIAMSVGGATGVRLAILDLPEGGIDALEAPLPVSRFEETVGFFPYDWSRDGRHILGTRLLANGEWSPAVHVVADGRLQGIPGPDGRPLVNFQEGASWLDSHRAVAADARTQRVYVHDLRTGATAELPGIPTPGEFSISADGRTLAVSRTRLESDIWMLTLPD